ncbi:MAG: sigma-54-dependent Fis family transcriptional regulator [Bdellovibrionales bacterium]|nr:sigma-54-dependent Fis family transcriptional regulator [Bdellovibrionales bacterium]
MAAASGSILFVDDEKALTNALIRRLSHKGLPFESLVAYDQTAALELLKRCKPEAAVIDLNLDSTIGPDSGLELIDTILLADPSVRIIVLTGHGEDRFGVEALNRGAASFNQKPVDIEMLCALLRDAVNYAQLARKYRQLKQSSQAELSIPGLITCDPSMKPILERIAYAAQFDQATLLIGETGVGKGVVAQAVHSLSNRKGSLIRYQPRYEGSDLIASELFGHERGAFTGATAVRQGLLELADCGTLFLDEIDQLPRETQVALLSALQERKFRRVGSSRPLHSNFALISATNCEEGLLISESGLREDFFHRIAHLIIRIPPLRDRPDDILFLADYFLRELANRENLTVQGLSKSAEAALRTYHWKGNVRELQAKTCAAAYHAAFRKRRLIELEDFDFREKQERNCSYSFRSQVRSFELTLIEKALQRHSNNQTRAAESLQLNRTQLRRILQRVP